MSNLYGTTQIASIEEMANDPELQRLFLMDDLLEGSVDQIEEFCNSPEGEVMMEKAALDKRVVSKATVRKMDLHRRIKLTTFYMAKAANDPNWKKLVKYQGLKKETVNKLLNKYGKKAERVAKLAQKKFIKTHKEA